MRTLAGPDAIVYFANLSVASAAKLAEDISPSDGAPESQSLSKYESTHIGVLELMKQRGVPLEKICLLDPKATTELSPEDGDGKFEWFLFGGILGDDPPRDRTGELRVHGFPSRRLGPVQMTTDTALGVTKLVIHDKIPLDTIKYVDHPTIVFNPKESVEMPFRYIADPAGNPTLPPGMREHLYQDLNQSFEF
ncbi:DUF431-domain-containing protein [Clavulina sp. PMI_390]|nr:DUF431-domain-containing protein [Clavulina sp. PMI_390]